MRAFGASLTMLAAAIALAGCGTQSDEQGAAGGPATEEATPATQPATPAPTAQPAASMLAIATGSEGSYLTDSSGRALYMFSKDENGQSSCDNDCAQTWQPVTSSEAGAAATTTPQPEAPTGAQPPAAGTGTNPPTGDVSAGAAQVQPGLVGSIVRQDGTVQVTYNGHPLYRYAQDQQPGQAEGQAKSGFGGEWYLVTPQGNKLESSAPNKDGA